MIQEPVAEPEAAHQEEEEEDPNIAFLKQLQINDKFHQLYVNALNYYKRTVGSHVSQFPKEFEAREKLLSVIQSAHLVSLKRLGFLETATS